MTASPSLLIATRNANKRAEFETIFERVFPKTWRIMDVGQWPEPLPDVVEDADTFEGNAIKKALETSQRTNMSTMSEDSGLMVDALHGQPGVYSKRFSGEDATTQSNNALLVERLKATQSQDRSARFVAVICLALCPDSVGQLILERMGWRWQEVPRGLPDQEGEPGLVDDRVVFWLRGELEGDIVLLAQGHHGFGYDPHFLVPSLNQTLAQLPEAQKSAISHRAKALDKLATLLHRTP